MSETAIGIAFAAHVIVIGAMALSFALMLRGRIGQSLAVVICVLCMAAMFWTMGALSGSSAGVSESWIAVGIVCGSFCFSTRQSGDS